MLIRYIGTIGGGVEIAATGDIVDQGATVEVSDELGVGLCEQTTNWEPANKASREVLDDFYRWVALHRRVPTNDEETEWRWEPIPDGAAAEVPDGLASLADQSLVDGDQVADGNVEPDPIRPRPAKRATKKAAAKGGAS